MKSIQIFFGNRLSDSQFFDDGTREETLEQGIRKLSQTVGGLQILRASPTSCSVSVTGSEHKLQDLKRYLDVSQYAQYEEDDPMHPVLRAAQD